MCGVGLLSMPFALNEGGWLSLLALLIYAVISCYTGILLKECLDSSPGLEMYPDIGQTAFGITGRIIVAVMLYLELYASAVDFGVSTFLYVGVLICDFLMFGSDTKSQFTLNMPQIFTASNGNLATAIHGKAGVVSFTPLAWSDRLRIMKGIANGLAYLHEFSPKKYVHGDLKLNNKLLGLNMEPQISDFGLARLANIAGGSPTLQSNRIMTVSSTTITTWSPYQAPEAVKMIKPSQKWDVYSFGVILLEMSYARSPMVQVGSSEMELVRWIQICIEDK